MNSKKALLITISSLFALTACDFGAGGDKGKPENPNPAPETEHHFRNGWSTSETKHWVECEDEGCDEITDEGYHQWGEWVYDSYATVTGSAWQQTTNPGTRHRECSVCGYIQEQEHNVKEGDTPHVCTVSSEWSTDETHHWHACTGTITTNNGWTTTTEPCPEKECYEPHNFGEWIIDNYAVIQHDASGNEDTVITIGNKHRVCSVCQYREDATHREEEPLAEHSHTFEDIWQYDENNHWKPCGFGKKEGYGGKINYVCQEKSQLAAHTWDNGVQTTAPTTTSEGIKTYTCTTCGATKQEFIPIIVDTSDGSESINVNFNDLSGKQVTVNPKIKAYADAMKAAEPSVAKPYHMTELKNGVDVCNYLDKSDYPDSHGQGHNKPVPVTISWDKGTMDYSSAIVTYSTNSDLSDAREISTTGNSVNLINLYSNAKYYFQLSYTKGTTKYKSNIGTFETADYTRFIDLGDIYNVRDMGGYKTSFGGRIKQGLIYRGSEIVPTEFKDNNGTHYKNVTADVLATQKDVLKIKVEIDHRSAGEANNINKSPLGDDVEYKREGYKISAYDSTVNDNSGAIKNIFEAFANADKKPVYFHCIGGADRTGCVAFILDAVLGMSYTDIIMDFEYTTETNWPRCRFVNDSQHYSRFPDFYRAFTSYKTYDANKTVCENAEAFLKSKNVSEATIEKLRKVMIEGYGEGGNAQEGGQDTPAPTTECVHTWGAESSGPTSTTAYTYRVCSKCGAKDFSWTPEKVSSDSAVKPSLSNGAYKFANKGDEVTYKITVDKAYTGKFYLMGFIDHYNNSDSSNASCGFFSGKNNGASGSNNNGSTPNTQVTINGTVINITNTMTYVEMGVQKGENLAASALLEVGACELKQGENIIKWKRLDSYVPTVYSLHFIGVEK